MIVASGERASTSADWDDLSGRIVIDHTFNDDVLVYASISQGYKSGGFNTSILSDGTAAGTSTLDDPFDKETAINYEVGTKSTWLDGRLRVNAAAFFTKYSDFQTQTALATGLGIANITVDAETSGVELDATFFVTENLSLTLATGYLNTEYTESGNPPDALPGTVPNIAEGQDLLRAPRFSHTLSANYFLPLGDAGNVNFNATWNYTEPQRFINSSAESLNAAAVAGAAGLGAVFNGGDPNFFDDSDLGSGYTNLLNARVTYTPTSEAWAVSVWATNLTDEDFRDSSNIAIDNGLNSGLGLATTSYTRNEPRQVGIEFTYNFGG